jgi:hypothetical protein
VGHQSRTSSVIEGPLDDGVGVWRTSSSREEPKMFTTGLDRAEGAGEDDVDRIGDEMFAPTKRCCGTGGTDVGFHDERCIC